MEASKGSTFKARRAVCGRSFPLQVVTIRHPSSLHNYASSTTIGEFAPLRELQSTRRRNWRQHSKWEGLNMKKNSLRTIACAALVILLGLSSYAVSDDNQQTARPLAVNQTEGFGDGQLLVFTYFQNFACIHQPFDDLDHNGQVAAVDANEFQRPICDVGRASTIDPTGRPIKETLKLYVIAPFFGHDTNVNDAFSPELGQALLSLFGFIPEAFKTHPTVSVQCPEPGPPVTQHAGHAGTCTMHTMLTDLGPVLAKLGKVPPNTSVVVPTLNHSHILGGTSF